MKKIVLFFFLSFFTLAASAKGAAAQKELCRFNLFFLTENNITDRGSYVRYHDGTKEVTQPLRQISNLLNVQKGSTVVIYLYLDGSTDGCVDITGYGTRPIGGTFVDFFYYFNITEDSTVEIRARDWAR
ncbi:MAG: hypothetical protein ACLVKO_09045 [Dysgonomonas sp.]